MCKSMKNGKKLQDTFLEQYEVDLSPKFQVFLKTYFYNRFAMYPFSIK